MAIECYYGSCRFHGTRESPPDEGPFCHERECRATEQELQQFGKERAGAVQGRAEQDDEAPIIEHQLCDLLEGLGASEDHQDAIAFFTKDGISEAAARRLVAALALHRFVPHNVLATYGLPAPT